METEVLIGGFLAAAVRVATPLLIAAIGETIVQRAGVLNLGLEGMMLTGALAAALGATAAGPWTGVLLAILAGVLLAAVFALIVVAARADQVIAGTAITLGAVGLTGTVYRQAYGSAGAGLDLPTLPSLAIPVLSEIPALGAAFFAQPAPTYLIAVLVPLVWWAMFRTRAGLSLRATGEAAAIARAAGVPTARVRIVATLIGGGFAGLAGATLVLAQVGTFAEKMTAGRGYVAIAMVVLGRWHPVGVAIAAFVFGAAMAVQFLFQALGLEVPYQLFLMLPYLLALLALAGIVGRVRAPGDLAKAS
jgi:ABC-type uncharacterized transport system permease subunit